MKKALGVITILVVLVILLSVSFIIEIPFRISGRGVIMPVEEWSLLQGAGGSLVHIHENHLNGLIAEYGVSEVQRGDVARYQFNDHLIKSGFIRKGDTIAKVYTSDIHLRIIELQGDLSYQQSLLAVYQAGEKPEEIRLAENQVELALQELENQQKQTDRIIHLYAEGVVSEQDYELSVNELKVKEYALEIARSFYNTLISGGKPEDIDAIRSRIAALETQLEQMQRHIDAFHLISPVSGKVIRERNPVMENTTEVILRIADFSSFVVLFPVDFSEEQYLETGQTVTIIPSSSAHTYTGELVAIDKTVRLISNRPKIFLTVLLSDTSEDDLYRNVMVQASVECGTISFWEYMNRLSKTVYQN